MAKARIVLLNQVTLPKLELMAALNAARLSKFITNTLIFCICSVNLWKDSQIVFHWIKGEKKNNTFVAHCITEIHSITDPNCRRYCPTLDNPVSLLTRGINSTQLRSSTLWKHGPPWSLNCVTDTWGSGRRRPGFSDLWWFHRCSSASSIISIPSWPVSFMLETWVPHLTQRTSSGNWYQQPEDRDRKYSPNTQWYS